MPEYDLLMNADQTVYAVNCRVEGTTLHCGALYLEPLIPEQLTRLAYNEERFDVQLPEDLLNQPTPIRAWSVKLSLEHE